MHDVWGFSAIFVTILAGMYSNDRGLDKLESRMDKGFDKIEGRLDRMQSDLSQFYRDLGDHGARIDIMEKKSQMTFPRGGGLSGCTTLLLIAILTWALTCSAQEFSPTQGQTATPAQGMVAYLFPEQITVTAGKTTEVDLHFRVADGLHINSHTPREKSLIPTSLAVAETSALKITGVDFPAGVDYAFAFEPNQKLSVYTGDFTLKAHLSAPAGSYMLEGLLRYQACDSRSCYPPKTVPVAVNVIAQ